MKVLFLDNFPTIFAINIPWALLFSWRQLFSMHSLISLNCIAEVRSSWNVIFSWSIPVVSVGCTAGFIPDLPRLPHTERHFHSCQQNPHQPPSLPTFSPNDQISPQPGAVVTPSPQNTHHCPLGTYSKSHDEVGEVELCLQVKLDCGVLQAWERER